MRIFPAPLDIGDKEGFSPEKDIFGRKGIGEGLTNVVSRVEDPLVIALDSEWGNGKTTFLKMWAGSLRSEGFPVVFFDAYEHDYADDAFTALAAEIVALAKDKKKDKEPASKKFVEKSLGAAKIILRSGVKLGVKLGTAGILEAEDLGNISKDIGQELSNLEDKYLGEIITKKEEERLTLKAFREALQNLPELLTDNATSAPRPLVVIIDELDRCRPPFALQVLERMKHFFSVPNVHFVLGAHLGQLRNSVQAVYGGGIDANKYLQKFIHLSIFLVDSALHPYQRSTAKYVEYLISELQIQTTRSDFIKNCLKHVSQHTPLSLRAIERIAANIATAYAFKSEKIYCPDQILVGLCIIKVVDPQLYAQLKMGEKNPAKVATALCLNQPWEESEKHSLSNLEKAWRYFGDPSVSEDDPQVRGFGVRLFEVSLGRFDVVSFVARSVVDQLASPK